MLLKLILATSILTGYIERPHRVEMPENSFLGSVFFSYNSSKISPESLRQVSHIAREWQTQCSFQCAGTIKVIGYADNSGASDYNLNLGLQRANEVADTLERLGVNMQEARVASFGDSKSLSRSQQFRRAEVWLERVESPALLNFTASKDKSPFYLALFAVFFLVVGGLGILLVVLLRPKRSPERFY